MPTDSRLTLWENVLALMQHHYGKENLTRFAAEVGIGPATASRIKEHETSVGLEVIEKIATRFGLDSWQLMVPGLDPESVPLLASDSEALRTIYSKKIKELQEALSGYLEDEGKPHILVKRPDDRVPPDSGLRLTRRQKQLRAEHAARLGPKRAKKA